MREGSKTISLRAESHGMSSFFHGSECLSNFNRLFSSRAFDCLYVSECENYIQDMNVKSKRDRRKWHGGGREIKVAGWVGGVLVRWREGGRQAGREDGREREKEREKDGARERGSGEGGRLRDRTEKTEETET